MATANELLHDAIIRRQVYLSRFSTGMVRDINDLLDQTESELRGILYARLTELEGKAFSQTTNNRLAVMANAIRKLREGVLTESFDDWKSSLEELAVLEAGFMKEVTEEIAPVTLDTLLPDETQLAALVSVNPMQGRLLREWADGIATADLNRIMGGVRTGMAQGQTTSQIVRRILGSGAVQGRDGILEMTRRDLTSVAQTAVSTIANAARGEYLAANDDVFTEEVYVATLDSRTTPECQALDGKRFKVGHGPVPPIHWNCRSTRVPLINGRLIGKRPSTSATEEALEGLKGEARIAKVRELTGQVPAETTYQTFLSRQSSAFQDEVLGPNRAALFREGGLTLDRFVNQNNESYTLAQLRSMEPAAFKRAGL